ncbi:lytic transglycosylase domain-containing protein [Rhodoplanes sp. Z2-YC6860]|uniref:lytic transglycosylase domain-containing protein n=1 Tax=Rhodoplanes sp. Z2-YC6860 TaxID=674703 RepID=UPI0008325DF9
MAPSKAELCATAVLVAQANNLPASFFTRLIRQESGFNPRVISSAGAQGIAQFMPGTASSRGLADPFEPTGALAASAKYLAELVDQFGNLGLAAAAYNAGPKRVQDWIAKRTRLPAETRNYVYSITGQLIQAWTVSRSQAEQIQLASADGCAAVAPALLAQNDGPPVSQSPEATVRSRDQRTKAAASERHGLPRPSHFIVGRPVAAAIKAAEAKVLAKAKWQSGTRHARHGVVRVASLR